MKMPDPGRLAARFDAMLRCVELMDHEYAEMRRRNATPEYADCCASHDFCDANMVMFDAFKHECGREVRLTSLEGLDEDGPVWNEAWAIAKADYLTEKP